MSFIIENGILTDYIGDKSVTSIVIPNGVKEVRRNVFNNCENLKSIFIPQSVEEFECNWCYELTEILVDENNPYLTSEEGILYDKNKTVLIRYPSNRNSEKFVIPDSVKEIDNNAFSDCCNLTEIIIPDTVEYIGFSAFYNCCSLTKIQLPSHIHGILDDTFMACCKLEEISIPDGVKCIYSHAFEHCDSLKKITLGKDVEYLDSLSFSAPNLEEIIVDSRNEFYSSLDGILYDKEKTILLFCPYGKKGKVVIPNTVTQIGACGFDGFCDCSNLTSIHVPTSVTHIASYAFADCTNLTSNPIPNGVVIFDTEW